MARVKLYGWCYHCDILTGDILNGKVFTGYPVTS